MYETLRDMALFVEVAKVKSFARAAEVLGIPKSTLSRRIADLEKTVGLRLLHRTTRNVDLTEAGALYYGRCRDIIEAAGMAHEELKDLAIIPRGTLRISMMPDFATAFMAPLCVKFSELHPEIQFDLDLSPRHVDLVADHFDLAIRLGAQRDSDLLSKHLCNVRTGLFATPHFIEQNGTPQKPEDLSRFPCIVNPNARAGDVWRLNKNGLDADVTVQGRFKANNPGVMRRLAMLGAGIIVLDEAMAALDLEAGRLERILPEWSLPPVPVTALTPSRLQPAKTRTFLEFLSRELKAFGT